MLLAVMLGGALGALARYLVNLALSQQSFVHPHLSAATFTVNVVGSFLLAFLVFFAGDNWRPELKLALTTGFLGSFTTFSTFELETLQLIDEGHVIQALVYVSSSVLVGFLAALAGRFLALQLLKT